MKPPSGMFSRPRISSSTPQIVRCSQSEERDPEAADRPEQAFRQEQHRREEHRLHQEVHIEGDVEENGAEEHEAFPRRR